MGVARVPGGEQAGREEAGWGEQAGRLFLRVFDGGDDFEEFDGGEAVAID